MSKKRLAGIYLRGMAMGAADVVPGVSGGTVAFITGIYGELLESIKSVNPKALKCLINEGPRAFWQHINGNFLSALIAGVISSILILASAISHALDNYPLLVWSFFFGLIAASSWHMAKQVNTWSAVNVLALVIGVLFAYWVIEVKPSEVPADLLFVFGAGAIALCAMILPGISGSFILVLMGMYSHILLAVKEFNWLLLATFGLGGVIGLLSISHLLSWLLHRFHDTAMTVLTGFILGSLYLIWPWKQTLTYYQNSRGEQLALDQKNVLPHNFLQLTGEQPETVFCLILMLTGVFLVLLLEKIGGQGNKK